MSCQIFKQPMPVIAISPSFWSSQNKTEKERLSVDQRVHQFLKNFESTVHLKTLVSILNDRKEKYYTPLVYPEQIVNLGNSLKHMQWQMYQKSAPLHQIERAYIKIGEVVQDMAYFTPRQYKDDDDIENLSYLQKTIKDIIKMNNTLVMKFETFDYSSTKLETKKLKGLLHKTNYFWQYKNFQVYKLLDKYKSQTSDFKPKML